MTYKKSVFNSVTTKLAIVFVFIGFALNNQRAFSKNSKIFVVANINNQIITNLDLKNRYSFFIKTSNIKISTKSEKLFILNQLLEKLIEESLQLQKAKSLNIKVPAQELEVALESVALSQGKTNKQILGAPNRRD